VLIPNLPYAEHDSLPTVVTELPPDNGRTALDVTSHLTIQRFQYLRKGSEDGIDLNCRDPTLPRDILRLCLLTPSRYIFSMTDKFGAFVLTMM
jgi:hypothetical protein